MENADLSEKGSKEDVLGGGLHRKSHGIMSKLIKDDPVIVLSELIKYAERCIFVLLGFPFLEMSNLSMKVFDPPTSEAARLSG